MDKCIFNNAGLRPALFFEIIKLDLDKLDNIFIQLSTNGLIVTNFDISKSFKIYLFEMIDELFTPYIVEEIILQKGRLEGVTSAERYKSFFLTSDCKWQKGALLIEKKYFKQIELLKKTFQIEIDAFEKFLTRYMKDSDDIKQYFKLKSIKIKNIKNIKFSLSDKHNFLGSSLNLIFDDNSNLIYKPKSAQSDIFFNKIISCLNQNKKRIIKTAKVMDCDNNYCWQEFIKHKTYCKKEDLNKFYRNVGFMLAVCDALNYTDGHSENFICTSNCQFILIDTETILTNLSYFEEKVDFFYDLEFTGMIQKIDKKESYISAIQKQCGKVYFPFLPYIINDCTDEISFSYRQIKNNEQEKSYPSKTKINLKNYVSSIKDGMLFGYQQIQKYSTEIKDIAQQSCHGLYLRQLKRHTLYYSWIMYRFFHPHNKNFKCFMDNSLSNLTYDIVEYEKKFISYANVPVFYHSPQNTNLFGINGNVIMKNYFQRTAIDWFFQKIDDLNNENFIANRIISVTTLIDG